MDVDDNREQSEVAFKKGDDRPIGKCLDEFWAAGEALEEVKIRLGKSEMPAAALSRLDQPPVDSIGFTMS